MSKQETFSEIHRTLDAFSAPPGKTVRGRICELLNRAGAAVHEAGFLVGDGTIAAAICRLAKDRDEQVAARMAAQKAQAAAEGLQETIAMERDTYAARWRAAANEAAESSAELVQLRAETQRQQAQLDWAAELLTAALRRGA